MLGFVACLALTLARQGGDPLQQPVSLHLPAIRVERLLEDLTKKTGVELGTVAPMRSEVVSLRFDRVPLKEVLDRLAFVLDAQWTEEEGRRTLKRSRETQKELDERDIQSRIEAFKPEFEKFARELRTLPVPYERARSLVASFEKTARGDYSAATTATGYLPPADLLLRQIMVAMGPRAFASVPNLHVASFATRPTAAEQPLPASTEAFLRDYSQMGEAFAQIANPDLVFKEPIYRKDYLALIQAGRSVGTVGKVLMQVYWLPGYVNVSLRTFDAKGTMRELSGVYLTTKEEFSPLDQDQRPPIPGQGKLTLDGIDAEIFGLLGKVPGAEFRGDEMASPDAPLSDETKSAILNPEKRDPLMVAGACLLASESAERPLMAVLPDSLQRCAISAYAKGEVNLPAFNQLAGGIGGLRREERDGWTLWTRANPKLAEARRLSRPVLGKLLRSAHDAKELSLRAVSRSYADFGIARFGNVVATSSSFLLSALGVTSADFRAGGMLLSLLGNLSDIQWKGLLEGETLDLANASPSVVVWLRDVAAWGVSYGENAGFDQSLVRNPEIAADRIPDLVFAGSEWMPSGVPRGTLLSLAFKSQTRARLLTSTNPRLPPGGYVKNIGVERLANMAFQTAANYPTESLDQVLAGKWSFGSGELFQVTIRAPLGVVIQRSFGGLSRFPKDDAGVEYPDWPEEFRKTMLSEIEKYKKLFGGG